MCDLNYCGALSLTIIVEHWLPHIFLEVSFRSNGIYGRNDRVSGNKRKELLFPPRAEMQGFPRREVLMKTLIIIPTYNEYENLQPLLRSIFSYTPYSDILIVDDNSPDGTGELADQLHGEDSRVHVIHRAGKLGLGTAYVEGFKYAISNGYDAAFEMDADFSHDPQYLPDFLQAIEHADLVIYRREVLENIDLASIESQGYAFQVELAYRVMKQGFTIVETPIVFMDRRVGKSKMSRKIVAEAFLYVLRTRFGEQTPSDPSVPLESKQSDVVGPSVR